MTTAQRMMDLFTGLDRAYGQYINGTVPDAKGKIQGKATTITKPVTVELWEAHLEGEKGLGIIPIQSDSTCVWGAGDIDVYENFDIFELEKKINDAMLPLLVCRSKSGGAHIDCFVNEPVPAKLMRTKLTEITTALGYPGIEIFPKQDTLDKPDSIGNWINMPYYNMDATERYCIKDDKQLTVDEFLELANRYKIDKGELKGMKIETFFSDGPPCLQHLAKVGFTNNMNNALFNVGVYCRKKYEDEEKWQTSILDANQKWMTPGSHSEVINIIKSLGKKGYTYKCKDAPIAEHCKRGECLKRQYGISESGPQDAYTNLVKIDSVPPQWRMDVNGQTIDIPSVNVLDNHLKIRRLIMEKLHIVPSVMKGAEWSKILRDLMTNVTVETVPEEFTEAGHMWGLIRKYCTGKAQAHDKQEMLSNKPWLNIENDCYYFSTEDMCQFLKKSGFNLQNNAELWKVIKAHGGEPDKLYINKRQLRFCKIPSAEVDPFHGVPDAEREYPELTEFVTDEYDDELKY